MAFVASVCARSGQRSGARNLLFDHSAPSLLTGVAQRRYIQTTFWSGKERPIVIRPPGAKKVFSRKLLNRRTPALLGASGTTPAATAAHAAAAPAAVMSAAGALAGEAARAVSGSPARVAPHWLRRMPDPLDSVALDMVRSAQALTKQRNAIQRRLEARDSLGEDGEDGHGSAEAESLRGELRNLTERLEVLRKRRVALKRQGREDVLGLALLCNEAAPSLRHKEASPALAHDDATPGLMPPLGSSEPQFSELEPGTEVSEVASVDEARAPGTGSAGAERSHGQGAVAALFDSMRSGSVGRGSAGGTVGGGVVT